MAASIKSIIDSGGSGIVVDSECHITNGLPNLVIVGLANKSVDESKERVRGAFYNSNIEMPRKRITINLAPADVPKDSASFDLPIAMSILSASQQIPEKSLDKSLVFGELGLDGSVRPVRGIIGLLLAGKKAGFSSFYIPFGNLKQACLVPGVTIFPVRNLKDLFLGLSGTIKQKSILSGKGSLPDEKLETRNDGMDFSEIVSQYRAKRALEIAAAGGHNIHLAGPPGTGKSMLAKAFPSILPKLSLDEVLEITHIHSLATKEYDKLITQRPFRSPHHSSSQISIVGGGQNPKPGEVSLSHHGILFFDEFPEFSRQTIESLRQPMEDKLITVARARDSVTFPANFILVAASNPCPCGYFGTHKSCNCTPSAIQRYQMKISGPIIDRIDLHVEVDNIRHDKLLSSDNSEEHSQQIRKRVENARKIQRERYKKLGALNSNISNSEIKKHIDLDTAAKKLLDQAAEKMDISARSYMKLIKVARTIADLDNSTSVDQTHVSEALRYRQTKITL